jgi:hypothetical protein
MLIYAFLAGMFLVNGIPHFVKGITGQTHMTPFKRVSSAKLNIFWAFINFYFGLLFMQLSGGHLGDITRLDSFAWAFLIGAIFMAWADAWLFSKPNARFPWHKD